MKKYTVVTALVMLAATAYSGNGEVGYFASPASYTHATAPKGIIMLANSVTKPVQITA